MDISKFHSDQHTPTFTVSYEVTQSFITPAPLHVMDMPKFFSLEKCTVYCVVSTCSTTSQKEIHVTNRKKWWFWKEYWLIIRQLKRVRRIKWLLLIVKHCTPISLYTENLRYRIQLPSRFLFNRNLLYALT